MEQEASTFLVNERVELSSGIYGLRLSRFWSEKLKTDYGIDAVSFYRRILSQETMETEEFNESIGAIFYAMLNHGKKQYSLKEASDIIELAQKELSEQEVQKKIFGALAASFMTSEQYERYKEVIEILMDPENEEEAKKWIASNWTSPSPLST